MSRQSGTRRGRGAPRGGSRLGALVWILVLLLLVFAGMKFVPPYWTYLALQDPVKEAAMAAAKPNAGEERARQQLIDAAKEHELELTEEQIEIDINNQILTLRVSWEVPVDLLKYRHVLRFQIERSVPAP